MCPCALGSPSQHSTSSLTSAKGQDCLPQPPPTLLTQHHEPSLPQEHLLVARGQRGAHPQVLSSWNWSSNLEPPSTSQCLGLIVPSSRTLCFPWLNKIDLVSSQHLSGMENIPKPTAGNQAWQRVTRSKETAAAAVGHGTWSGDQALSLLFHLPTAVPTPSAG